MGRMLTATFTALAILAGATMPAAAGGFHDGPGQQHWRADAPRGHGTGNIDRRQPMRACDPREALHRAKWMGIRHARVVDVDRRTVTIYGHARHGRVNVNFANRPGCPAVMGWSYR
ncbi:hypothetical protein FJU08_10475 [Martelella alba]|uniref:Antifreeze protein n=1 Tax=Martelella alba TaxID=2590451 RepID=A0A506UAX5_9HYPH|nr:hypothetical protein [Martelella alba]TPW31070.1 hypothetical protein FJU08_10475 [Martelella alba]